MRPILIAGAGIAGLTLGLTLARRGMASRILERRAALGEAGAGIQLGPNAMHVLRRLGVAERLQPQAARPQAIMVADGASGRRLGRLPLGDFIERRHGAPYWVAHRGDLQAALLAAVRAEPLIELVTGFEVVDWRETADSVDAISAGGDVVEGRALVGADGLWSALRRRMFPDHALTYAGKMAARTVIPATRAAADGRFGELVTGVWLGRHAHVVHYPIRRGRDIAVVAIVDEAAASAPAPERTAKASAREGWGGAIEGRDVLQRLAGFSPELLEFLARGSEWAAWSLYDPAPLPAWSRGRIALIGDAAHPILPFLAQGGAMAIEAAETLAAELALSRADPAGAFARTESLRRARVIRVQDASRANGRMFHLGGLTGLARDAALKTVPGRLMMARYDWLYGWNGDPPTLDAAR